MNVFFYDYDDFDHTTLLVDWFETELRRKVEKGDYDNAVVRGNRQRDKTVLQFEWSITCYSQDDCLHAPTDAKTWPWGLTSTMLNATKQESVDVNKIENDWAKQWKKDTEKISPYPPFVKSTIHKENVIWGQGSTGSSEELHDANHKPPLQKVNGFGGKSLKLNATKIKSYPSKSSPFNNKEKHFRGMMPEIKRPFNSHSEIKSLHTKNKNYSYKRIKSTKKSTEKKKKAKAANGENHKRKLVVSRGKINDLPPPKMLIHKLERKPPFTKPIKKDTVKKHILMKGMEKPLHRKTNHKKHPQSNQEISRFGVGGKKIHNGIIHAKFATHSTKDIFDKLGVKTHSKPISKISDIKNNKQSKLSTHKKRLKIKENPNSKSPFKRLGTTTILPTIKTSRIDRFKTLQKTIPIVRVSSVNSGRLKPTTSSSTINSVKEGRIKGTTMPISGNAKPRKSSKANSTKTTFTSLMFVSTEQTPLQMNKMSYQMPKKSYTTPKSPFYNGNKNQLSRPVTPRNGSKSLTKIASPLSRSKKLRKYPPINITAKDSDKNIFYSKETESYVPVNTVPKRDSISQNARRKVKPEHKLKLNHRGNKPAIPKMHYYPSDTLHTKHNNKSGPTKFPFHDHTHGGMLKTMSDLIREQEEAETLLIMHTTKGLHVHKFNSSLNEMTHNSFISTSKPRISTDSELLESNHRKQMLRGTTSASLGTLNKYALSKLNHRNSKKSHSGIAASPVPETSSKNMLPQINRKHSKTNNTQRATAKQKVSTKYVLPKPNPQKHDMHTSSSPKPRISANDLKYRSSYTNKRIRDKLHLQKTKRFQNSVGNVTVASTKKESVGTTSVYRLQTTVETKGRDKKQMTNAKHQGINKVSVKSTKTVHPTLEIATIPLSTQLPTSLKHSNVVLVQTLSPVVHHDLTTNQSLLETTTKRLPWWKWTTAPRYFLTSPKYGQWTQFTRWWQRPKTTPLRPNLPDTSSTFPHTHIYTRRTTPTSPFRRHSQANSILTSTLPYTHIYTRRTTHTSPFRRHSQANSILTSTLPYTHIYTRRTTPTSPFRRHSQANSILTSTLPYTHIYTRRTTASPFRRHSQISSIPTASASPYTHIYTRRTATRSYRRHSKATSMPISTSPHTRIYIRKTTAARPFQRHSQANIQITSTLPYTHIYTMRTSPASPFRRHSQANSIHTTRTSPHTHTYSRRKPATNRYRSRPSTTPTITLPLTHINTRRIPVTNMFGSRTLDTTVPNHSTLSHTLRTTVLNPFRYYSQTTTQLPVVTLHSHTNPRSITKNAGQHTVPVSVIPITKVKNKYTKIKMKTDFIIRTEVPKYSSTSNSVLKVTMIPKEITLQKQITNVTPKGQTSKSINNSKTTTLLHGKQIHKESKFKEESTKLKSGNNDIKIRTHQTLKYPSRISERVTAAYTESKGLRTNMALSDGSESQSSKHLNHGHSSVSKNDKHKRPSTKVRNKTNNTSKNSNTSVNQRSKVSKKSTAKIDTVRKSDDLSKKANSVTEIPGLKTVHTISDRVKPNNQNVLHKPSTKVPFFNFDSKIFHKLNKSIKKRPINSEITSRPPHPDNVRTFSPQIRPNIWKRIKKKKPRVLWKYSKDNKYPSGNNSSRWWSETTFRNALTSTVSPKRGRIFDLKALVAPFLKPNLTRHTSVKPNPVSLQPVVTAGVDNNVVALDRQSPAKKNSTKHFKSFKVSKPINTKNRTIYGDKITKDGRRLPNFTHLPHDKTVVTITKIRPRQHLNTKTHMLPKVGTVENLTTRKVTPSVLPKTTNLKRLKGRVLQTTQPQMSYSEQTTLRVAKNRQNAAQWRKFHRRKETKANKSKKKLLPWNRWLTTTNKMLITKTFNRITTDTDVKELSSTIMPSKQMVPTTAMYMSSTSIGQLGSTKKPKSNIKKVLHAKSKHGKTDLKDIVDGFKLYSHKTRESKQNKTNLRQGYKKEISTNVASDKATDTYVTAPVIITTVTTERITNLKNRTMTVNISKSNLINNVSVKSKDIKYIKSNVKILKSNTSPTPSLPSDFTIKQKIMTTLSNIAISTKNKLTLRMLNKTIVLKSSTPSSQPTSGAIISNKTVVTKGTLRKSTIRPSKTKDFPVKHKQTQMPRVSTTGAKTVDKKLSTSTVRKLVKQTTIRSTRTTRTATSRGNHSTRAGVPKQTKKVLKSKPNPAITEFNLKNLRNFKIGMDHKNTKTTMTKHESIKSVRKITTPTSKTVKKTAVAAKPKYKQVKKKVSKQQTRPPHSIISNPSIRGPGVVVPDEGLFVPRFVFPDIRHNINRNISEGSVAVLVHSGSEARHIGLQVRRLNVKAVFNRYWPAILGLTIGTVFLVAAILTSVACRAQRLYVQRTRYLDTPQHLTEPPDTSEYSSSSAASLVSDRTRSSIRL